MRNIGDVATEIRDKLARLTALCETAERWQQGEWPDATRVLSLLTEAELTIEKLRAHAQPTSQETT